MLLSWLWMCGLAWGGDFYLEGPSVPVRSEAVTMVQAAAAQGYRARVVRRYRHGLGWEFVLRVEGFEERAAATAAASELAGSTGRGIGVFSTEGDVAVPVELDAADAVADAAEEDAAALDAEAVMNRVVRAHGGSDGGIRAIEAAESLVFEFRRTTPDGLVVDHVYARRGEDLRLAVTVVEGAGTSSVTTVTEGGATLSVGEGEPGPVASASALEAIGRLSPERVLGLSLSVTRDASEREDLSRLRADGTTTVADEPCRVLRYDGDRVLQSAVIAVSETDWTLRQAAFGSGVLFDYSEYREGEGGLTFPTNVRVWRHRELVDHVEITRVDAAPSLPEEWFGAGP